MRQDACEMFEADLMALIDGSLEGPAAEALQAHLDTCSRCRDELAVLQRITGDLEFLGDSLVENVPPIDLVDAVMGNVAQLKSVVSAKVVPFTPPVRQQRSGYLRGFAVAAAGIAAALLLFWVADYRITKTSTPGTVQQTQAPGTGLATGESPSAKTPSPDIAQAQRDLKGRIESLDKTAPGPRWAKTEPVVGDTGELSNLKVADVLAMRRDAVNDPDARAQLARWASLSREKAKEVALSKTASTEAKLGTVDSLDAKDAETVLLAALSEKPNDPYLHSRLADVYEVESGYSQKAVAELETASRLEPKNSLTQYQLASQYLEGGDIEGAKGALGLAVSLEEANANISEALKNQIAALIESGVDPEVAKLLASITGGTLQYSELTGLAEQLLDYGRYYQESGQTDLAQQIYQAVQTMGAQIADDATYSSEQLAGLDIEQAALEMLSGLVDIVQSPEGMQALSEQISQLQAAFANLGTFITALDELFATSDIGMLTGQVIDHILESGDLNIFEYLNSSSN